MLETCAHRPLRAAAVAGAVAGLMCVSFAVLAGPPARSVGSTAALLVPENFPAVNRGAVRASGASKMGAAPMAASGGNRTVGEAAVEKEHFPTHRAGHLVHDPSGTLHVKQKLAQREGIRLASTAALASKVLLERSQELAMAGQRDVIAAHHARLAIEDDVRQRNTALAVEERMDTLASKDVTESDEAGEKGEEADRALKAARDTQAAHERQAQAAAAMAAKASARSAEDDAAAKQLRLKAEKAAREAQFAERRGKGVGDSLRKQTRKINHLKKSLVVNEGWVAGHPIESDEERLLKASDSSIVAGLKTFLGLR